MHPQELLTASHNTWIEKTSLANMLRGPGITETAEMKVLRCANGVPIVAETTNHGLTTSPIIAVVIPHNRRNTEGIIYKAYAGLETVNFKYGYMRGQFIHDAILISSITFNFTTIYELFSAVVEIGVYCRKYFELTSSRSYEQMQKDARKIIRNKINDILMVDREDLVRLARFSRKGKYGKLTIIDSSEYQSIGNSMLRIELCTFNLLNAHSHQVHVTPEFEVKG